MPSKHVDLYNFATCPGYARYFISLIGGVLLGGDKGKLHIERGGQAHAPSIRRGWKGLSGKDVGRRSGTAGRRTVMDKRVSFVGDVFPYVGAHQGGMGGHIGDRENDQVWNVQHP